MEQDFKEILDHLASDDAQKQVLAAMDAEIEADERAVAIYDELDRWMSEPDRSHLRIVR